MEDTWTHSWSEECYVCGVGVGMSSLNICVYVCMCVDEELGGDNGMGEFVKTPFFAEMNVGFALDEGGQ